MPPDPSGGNRWLIYALGGGLGHLTRAVALARVARGSGHCVRVLTNSPFAAGLPLDQDLGDDGALTRIDPARTRGEVASIVGGILEAREFDVLIVDTFPRGLGGELVPFLDRPPCPKVLIHRDLDPAYVRWADLRSIAMRFDLLILPGEDAPLGDLPHAIRTPPWLLRERAELLDRPAARRRLDVGEGDNRLVIVVAGCGRLDEIEAARSLSSRLESRLAGAALVRFVSVQHSNESATIPDAVTWPLLEVMAGIDVLVGSGGYNTVYEARATATPLVALARPRKYDRQARRLLPVECAGDETEVIRRVEGYVVQRRVTERAIPCYVNGVHAAIERIEELTAP
jgi:hypothetical protein